MVAEENMLSSVTATDKLKTLIKLTGSPPFPNPSNPQYMAEAKAGFTC